MRKKKGGRKMGATARVIQIFDGRVKKNDDKFTQVKSIKDLTKNQMKSSNSFKKRDEERN